MADGVVDTVCSMVVVAHDTLRLEGCAQSIGLTDSAVREAPTVTPISDRHSRGPETTQCLLINDPCRRGVWGFRREDSRDVIDLPGSAVAALPVDQLGLIILADLVESREWNEYNYILAAQDVYRGEALEAVAEAMTWLRARALIARKPGQSSDSAIFVTRTGHRVVADGPQAFYANERLQGGVHPAIESKARPQFLIGEYEQGVFASMKAVEVRVRKLGEFGDEVVGVDLMNKAFGPGGPLTDPTAVKGEQEGTRAMFAGAYSVLRNPAGHREVDYDDVTEAAEAVHTASLLMRMLDRVERRLT